MILLWPPLIGYTGTIMRDYTLLTYIYRLLSQKASTIIHQLGQVTLPESSKSICDNPRIVQAQVAV